jgi:GntR family transcriptional regulator
MFMTTLSKHTAVPLYLQLKDLLNGQIANGTLAAHSRVPSERELSEHYAISRMTARQALAELIQEGRLYTSRGKGTFVAEPKIQQNLHTLTSFSEDMRARGHVPSVRLLRRELLDAPPPVARHLQIGDGTPVVCLERLRLADNEPMALETAYLCFAHVDQLLMVNVEQSLYALLRERFALVPASAQQEWEARLARPREHTLLKLPPNVPVLAIQRTTFDSDERPFEYVQSVYRGDRYRFVARLTRLNVEQ